MIIKNKPIKSKSKIIRRYILRIRKMKNFQFNTELNNIITKYVNKILEEKNDNK